MTGADVWLWAALALAVINLALLLVLLLRGPRRPADVATREELQHSVEQAAARHGERLERGLRQELGDGARSSRQELAQSMRTGRLIWRPASHLRHLVWVGRCRPLGRWDAPTADRAPPADVPVNGIRKGLPALARSSRFASRSWRAAAAAIPGRVAGATQPAQSRLGSLGLPAARGRGPACVRHGPACRFHARRSCAAPGEPAFQTYARIEHTAISSLI